MPIDIDAIRKRNWTPLLGQSTARALDRAILDRRDLLAEVDQLRAELGRHRADIDRLRAGIKAVADRWAAPPAPIRVAPYEAELFVEDLCNLLDAGGAA